MWPGDVMLGSSFVYFILCYFDVKNIKMLSTGDCFICLALIALFVPV